MSESPYLGYLKYEGELTRGGVVDARSAAQALRGFDRSIRYFLEQQRPDLADLSLPIPVKIEPGSWIAALPTEAISWLTIALGSGATAFSVTYAREAAKKMAENDFKDVGLKEAFKKAFEALAWTIKIGKHLGGMAHKAVMKLKWKNETVVGLPDSSGEYLYVPVEFLQLFLECPNSLLNDVAGIIEADRALVVGYRVNGEIREEKISIREKMFFAVVETDLMPPLFPELEHGRRVRLDGVVTRGNGTTNTIGFRYNDHILTCRPADGKSITRYKRCLFVPCRIYGTISRSDDKHVVSDANRPWIAFDDLRIIENGNEQATLL